MSIFNEEILRSDPLQGSFSATGLETYLTCPRKFYLKYLSKLSVTSSPASLVFGAAIHHAVGTFYTVKDLPEGSIRSMFSVPAGITTAMLMEYVCVRAFTQKWNEAGIEGDGKRNLVNGIDIICKYISTYKGDTAAYLPEYIETNTSLMMPNGTRLICIIDRIQKESSYISVCDTKTSSWPLTDYFFKKFINSFQLSCYDYATISLLGDCDNVCIDGILVPNRGTGDSFIRRTFLRTDHQRAEFLNTYTGITDRIREDLAKSEEDAVKCFSCNPTACDNYGGCEYIPLCQYGFTASSLCIYKRG